MTHLHLAQGIFNDGILTPMAAHVIVGLGNPGDEYKNTRHNVGRMAVSAFATEHGFPEWNCDKKANALITSATLKVEGKAKKGTEVLLILPETFMNKSGNAVKRFVTSPKKAESLVVVHDDMDLPRGIIKISFNRGAGGHHGVESIIRAVRTTNFTRIRIGVSDPGKKGAVKKPKGDKKIIDFLVKEMDRGDLVGFKKISSVVDDALLALIFEGRSIAMNKHN